MKKTKKIIILALAMLMIMQVILPTISQAVETAKLNIQFERPYNDDNGDGTIGNDIYTLTREAIQTVFKIGDQNLDGDLSFNNAYYCLRAGLGFGSTEEILDAGVDYNLLADLNNSDAVKSYFKDTIGYDISEANYNAICWIADNMYLPKSEYAEDLKAKLLKNAEITNSKLTDDDIEVVQQIALWYFTNYDENGGKNSVSLADTANLGLAVLQINGENYNNDEEKSFNYNRAQQINKLYKYLVDTAKEGKGQEKIPEKMELDKTLEPTIEEKTISKLNAYVVGPFKINETQKANIDYDFTYSLKYKLNSEQETWQDLQIDNKMGTVFLSDENGNALDRNKDLKDMISGEEFYIAILKDVLNIASITDFKLDINYNSTYYNTKASVWVAGVKDQPVLKVEKEQVKNPGTDSVTIQEEVLVEEFDLSLRKYISYIGRNGNAINFESRVPKINTETLVNGTFNRNGKLEYTATYEHSKEPIYLKRGDTIVYTIRVYNEGEVDGYVKEVTDYLCDGLEIVENSEINSKYGWVLSEDGKTLTTDYLKNTLIKAYNSEMTKELLDRDDKWQQTANGPDGLYYADVQIECRIKETANVGITLPNVAEISNDLSEGDTDIPDRDSEPKNLEEDEIRNYENTPWFEDDDDYERVIIEEDKVFDLSLRKYISNIERKGEALEFDSREPKVDTKPLQESKTTANYIHPKNALTVKQGDIITYKLRVYNEGELDGFVTEITDYIPEGLGLLLGYTGNANWLIKSETKTPQPLVGENGIYKTKEAVPVNGIFENEDLENIQVVTGKEGSLKIVDNTSLDDKLIRHFGAIVEDGELFYQEVEVTCIVLAPNTYEGIITNIAEISEDKAIDEFGTEVNVEDRDSRPANVMDDGKHTPGAEENRYTPGEQDDDDFEPVQLKYFDLALRKFITGVNDEAVNTRIPQFKIDEEGNYVYEHDKTPVEVTNKDEVTYTIRVFNEGSLPGYAEEIEDDIPEGLIFLPENETNKNYGWKMYYYDEDGVLTETEDVKKAEVIRTTYLSEANGTINEETGKNSNLLTRFDKEAMESPDYRDVKVVFKVSQADIPEENDDRIIINKAHITEDSDDDEDSIPDKWNEGEDDQDREYIYVQEFDLALHKWVTQTIVTVDGKTTTTETGFKPNIGKTEATGENFRDNNEAEPIASVTIDKKKLKSTVVKFVYNIRVVNEGDIAGYATEVTDYIPEGLKFVAEDNPLWTLGEDGKITTRALETILLKPGESREIPVTFTWINDVNNLGVKTNIAAITEDYNDKNVEDIDSVPGNEDIPNYEKEQEDDDDFALVILTLKTGKNTTYISLMLLCITIISAGAITIKKYVL